jgi:hypothetical protein
VTFPELYHLARVALADTATPPLLSQDVALALFNEAEQEACRRAPLLLDSSTAAVCQIALEPGASLYPLDSRIVKIMSARTATRSTPLAEVSAQRMDQELPQWELGSGTPTRYVSGYATGKFRPYPVPVSADTVHLRVWRTPLNSLTVASSPEIPERYHKSLIHWVVASMRDIEDTELYDPRKAEMARMKFDAEFGPKRGAFSEVCDRAFPMFGGMN